MAGRGTQTELSTAGEEANHGRHTPVLLTAVLKHLGPTDGQAYIDATFGAGGYTRAILEAANLMERLAAQYQDEVDDAIRRLVSAIEPTLVAILAIVIGGILLSVMLPLANLMSSLV